MKKIIIILLLISIVIINSFAGTTAVVKTNMGEFKIRLYPKDSPKTVANFVRYAENNKFKNSVFYRIVNNFIIQGGGYTINRKQNIKKIQAYKPVKSEADNGLYNIKKTVAMARSGNDPHSATCSFFINLKSNKELNYGFTKDFKTSYTVFGRVISGWDVVEKIAGLNVQKKNQFKNYPVKDVIIENILIKKK
jgi:cyclophilin family peptidyl-prolyl cis-trans isomerase